VRQVEPAQHRRERGLGEIPVGVVSGAALRPRRERERDTLEAERGVERRQGAAEALHLGLDLRLGAEHVPIVLRELPQPQQAVQRAARLVAVDDAELAQADRQLTVRGRAAAHDLDVPRTAHGLHPGVARIVLDTEHAGREVLPVAARFPDRTPQDLRCPR
jgi:hypothetical protein